MGIAGDLKFRVQIDRQSYKPKNAKVGQRGVVYVKFYYALYFFKIYNNLGQRA